MSRLCVIVPTYNEAKNLGRLLRRIEEVLHGSDFTVVVVDDNSLDGTADVAQKLNGIYGNVVLHRRARKSGLGSAIREGLRVALSMDDLERIVTMDGDMSHNPDEIPSLLCACQGEGLVQGSRYIEKGSISGWSMARKLMSRFANVVCRLLLRVGVHDCTGNFRVYSRGCAEAIVGCTRRKGFDWVVEAAFAARRCGFRLKEVPITFRDRRSGRTKLEVQELVNWAFFALRTAFLSMPSSLTAANQASRVIQRSSALTVTVVDPIVSTTK